MKFLVFQHIDCEHPGSFRDLFKRENIEWDAINLDQGENIPALLDYDALWVMGGPMDIWDVDEHPWLIKEKDAIREWVLDHKKPFLGLCLGHQLLADALGGTCGPLKPPEVGVMQVSLTAAGLEDPLFKGLSVKQTCLQWHSVKVAQAPKNTIILAESDHCKIQAMRVGEHAWSMQYHVEIEADTFANWAKVPEYHQAALEALGEDGFATMRRDAEINSHNFLNSSEIIFNNFISFVKSQ